MSAPEPTASEVLAAVHELRHEMRASLAELRADWADRWSRQNERLDDISRRLGTLIDEIADLRREYSGHTHPGEAA